MAAEKIVIQFDYLLAADDAGVAKIAQLPELQSQLFINGELMINLHRPVPCAWHRFWQKILLGFVWKKYED